MEDTVRNKHAAPCFHGGRVFESIGLDYSNMRLLETSYAADVLDAWYPPAPSVVEKLSQHLAWGIRTSPPPTNSNVIFAIADAYKLDPHTIVIGAGSSELIYRVLPNFIDQRGVLIPKPAYGEYEHIVRNIYGLPVYEMFTDQVAFKIDISRLLAQTKIYKPSAIVLINPSNPSGQNITRSELIELINQVDSSINLIVDETYSEYNSNIDSIADLCSTYRNLIIFKSLSKTFALSGLRAGFCVVHRTHAESLCGYTPPYIIPTLTQMALYESFKNIQYYQEQIKNTHESKQYFVGLLDKHAPMIKTIHQLLTQFY